MLPIETILEEEREGGGGKVEWVSVYLSEQVADSEVVWDPITHAEAQKNHWEERM